MGMASKYHKIISCQILNRFLPLGYIFWGEIAHEMWQVAAEYEIDDSCLINVEMAIDALESSEEPLSETEQKLLNLCKAAETQGLGDIVINPE